jgi:hypothetical protein
MAVKCFQCDKTAIGVCRWCELGQCEEHMQAGLEARRHIPIMGFIHQYTGENMPVSRAPGEPHGPPPE